MTGCWFIPEFEVLETMQGTFSEDELLQQRGFYGADLDFAWDHASPVLQKIIEIIPQAYIDEAKDNGMELNLDVRVHQLFKGEYPATPGWHCDAPQRETEFSNNHETTPVLNSLVINVSSCPDGVSNTVFLTKPIHLNDDTMTLQTWSELDHKLGTDLNKHHKSNDGELIKFSCFSPHCVEPAQNDGVRLFARISQWVKPQGFRPGLSRIEQVYRTRARMT